MKYIFQKTKCVFPFPQAWALVVVILVWADDYRVWSKICQECGLCQESIGSNCGPIHYVKTLNHPSLLRAHTIHKLVIQLFILTMTST